MLSLSEFEQFKVSYYKGQWKGQRFGQAFLNHSGFVHGPNPILFYDPSDERAADYIRRHYVYNVVEEWTHKFANGSEIKVQLQMTESRHRLYNLTSKLTGDEKPLDQIVEVYATPCYQDTFIFSSGYPCDGDLYFCEVVG